MSVIYKVAPTVDLQVGLFPATEAQENTCQKLVSPRFICKKARSSVGRSRYEHHNDFFFRRKILSFNAKALTFHRHRTRDSIE